MNIKMTSKGQFTFAASITQAGGRLVLRTKKAAVDAIIACNAGKCKPVEVLAGDDSDTSWNESRE